MQPVKVPIGAVSAATGESVAVIYDAINAGHLKTFLVGRRRYTRPEYIRAWVDYLEAESNAGRPVMYRPRASQAKFAEATE
jgi:hypothetical protein